MSALFASLMRDDHGFVVSAELVLVATLLVIGLIVGLREVQGAVVAELNDVGEAIGSVNQSFYFSGFSSADGWHVKGVSSGSSFQDRVDQCDRNECDLGCDHPTPEKPKWH